MNDETTFAVAKAIYPHYEVLTPAAQKSARMGAALLVVRFNQLGYELVKKEDPND